MSTAETEHRSVDLTRARSSRASSSGNTISTITESRAGSGHPAPLPGDAREQTDDEILGLDPVSSVSPLTERPAQNQSNEENVESEQAPAHLEAIFNANPELRQAWQDVSAYRESFATPEDARAATAALADLDKMDSLFFSNRAGDHAELARAVAALNPAAFNSLAQAMAELAGEGQRAATEPSAPRPAVIAPSAERTPASPDQSGPTAAQEQFLYSTNAQAVQGVLDAIESQLERSLPEGISKGARNRVVGEIYRELDAALRSNQQLAQQVHDAFRSGALDDSHRQAIVSLITGRARQALPAVAKRVLNEWTSTVVAANQDRRARQRDAERRVDIAGSGRTGSDSRRPLTSRDIDYSRMSDADILNL